MMTNGQRFIMRVLAIAVLVLVIVVLWPHIGPSINAATCGLNQACRTRETASTLNEVLDERGVGDVDNDRDEEVDNDRDDEVDNDRDDEVDNDRDDEVDNDRDEEIRRDLDCEGEGNVTFSADVPFQVRLNMDVGDPSLTSVVMAENGMGNSFVAVIAPGYNLDFESARIEGQYAQTDDDVTHVACAAEEWAGEADEMIYVGAGNAFDGWSKDFPSGWEMHVTLYTETPVEVDGSNWETFNVSLEDKHNYGDADGYSICQLWNGVNSKLVWHVIVEPGLSVTSPRLQGTCWVVTGEFDPRILMQRAEQMAEEVFERDDEPRIVRIFVGDTDNKPNGWDTNAPNNWSAG